MQPDKQHLHNRILVIFRRFLREEEELRGLIDAQGADMTVTESKWQFTLPSLYVLCCTQDSQFAQIGYSTFRKLLYRFPTNKLLAPFGGKVMVGKQRSNVNRTTYELRRV
ncbi:MAG: hypothetical protein AAF402_02730 [Pseudomonadota bacterium]